MRVLILMRHGKSDWHVEGALDFNRPLNGRGIRETIAQAQALLRAGYKPDGILTSPAIRAWHTAHLVAQATSLQHAQVQPVQAFYEGTRREVVAAIAELPEIWHVVLLVGHNPTWSELASQWMQKPIELRTAEAAAVALPAEATWPTWTTYPLKPLFYLAKPA